MGNDIVIIGSGGHAKCIIDIIQSMDKYNIRGIITKEAGLKSFMGYPVLGDDSFLSELKNRGISEVAIGIGGYRDNIKRTNLYNMVLNLGLKPATLIHKNSHIGTNAIIGQGSVIFPGVIINTEACIGSNTIVGTFSSVDHETQVGNNVLISAGVTVGAYAIIGNGCLLGLGSKVVSGGKITENCLIGAGAVVVKEITETGVYYGVPARRIK